MNKIHIICDYKNRFESKYTAEPYRSGFNKNLLKECFNGFGFEVSFIHYPDIDFRSKNYKSELFLYSSSEEKKNLYKSYIEDIILGLELTGAIVIPQFKYLRAQNNKLFMEVLRNLNSNNSLKKLDFRHFGTIEELRNKRSSITGTYVIKPSEGAKSKGISSASDFERIVGNVKKISRSPNLYEETKDILRRFRHKGYIPDSRYSKKFILQEMISDLPFDWKILIFNEKYYVLKRQNRKKDFRASGSGLFHFEKNLPAGLLDFARNAYNAFKSPNLSIDIGFNGKDFYLIEFQFLYFGSYTLEYSEFYFIWDEDQWGIVKGESVLEMEYARSVAAFINREFSGILG
jgi:glutathione synthase/RimK-type ligase-like ATP-grasp enzyme